MLQYPCCGVCVMHLHDVFLLRTFAILPEAISDEGLTPATDTDLFLATYRSGSRLTSDVLDKDYNVFAHICHGLLCGKRSLHPGLLWIIIIHTANRRQLGENVKKGTDHVPDGYGFGK